MNGNFSFEKGWSLAWLDTDKILFLKLDVAEIDNMTFIQL